MSDLVLVIEQFTWEVYTKLEEMFGKPKNPLKQVITGGLNYNRPDEPVWALCEQLLGKSCISYDNELFLESDRFIIDIVCHELAHVWAGNENGHNKVFKDFYKKFKNIVDS